MWRDTVGRARNFAALALVATAVVAAGCGDDEPDKSGSTNSTKSSEPVDIAFLFQGVTSYTGPLGEGVKEVAAKAENANIKTFSANQDPAVQLRQCQDAIATGQYEGMLINAVDNVAVVPCLKQAKAAGMTIVNVGQVVGPDYNSEEIQLPEVDGQVIGPLVTDIAITADLIEQACADKDPCNIGWLTAEPTYSYSANKLKGAKEEMKNHPNQKLVATAKTGFDNPDGATSAVRNMLQAHPDLDVIVNDDDATLQGAVRMKQRGELPEDVLLIGDGGNEDSLVSIKAGDQFGTVFNGPHTIGVVASEMIIKLLRGEEVEDNNVNALLELGEPGRGSSATQENIDQFTAEW